MRLSIKSRLAAKSGLFSAAALLAAWGALFAGQQAAVPDGEEEALRIEVIGRQWEWEVRYPDSGVVLIDELHLPAGRPVSILLGSSDVVHSFWVPRLGRRQEAVPGRIKVVRLRVGQVGNFSGQCSQQCGDGHARMQLQVRVHEPGEFAVWLAERAAGGRRPGRAPALRRVSWQSAGSGVQDARAPQDSAISSSRHSPSTSPSIGR